MALDGVRPAAVRIVAFDMFGTLAQNDRGMWRASIEAVAREQELAISGANLHREWSAREGRFRDRRTNMADPAASPPFLSYEEAWCNAFAETFADLGLNGDAAAAAKSCCEAHAMRPPFTDSPRALAGLASHVRLAVLSNADDRFLEGLVANQGWVFETVLSSEGARAYKPDPRIFATFCDLVGVEPGEVLYVGDSVYDDVHGAKLAGMQAVHLQRDRQMWAGPFLPPAGVNLLPADDVIETLAELGPLLGLGAAIQRGERP
jgi:2-haloalkanoic acid dehalogenase type II